ncbi:MAG: 2-succinyl-5-enolpyruvyl-6-hydroxy-3-cyclohexene-1-carboxylic-acid synthase [Muribaculaceae bacterium]|nr:2-succinyl-5-enolpyruvyl-6-hydroxy-3-cyclohexene-1-carboxylic-acid synthase [Muribaculaceae bacterium]
MTFTSILFDLLEMHGVRDIVCSPGSRNVPLLLEAEARPLLRKHFVVDERSAAFMGLGMSLVSQQPVALVCTSGTALLNYAPAVAEAYYQSIPLIVISADRPIQWIDQDDSQTLRQDGALDNYVKKSFSIPALGEDNKEMLWYVKRIVNEALILAKSGRPGPVHINVHLGEPLNRKVDLSERPSAISTIVADTISNKEILKDYAEELSQSNVMLVAGFDQPSAELQKAVGAFARHKNVVVMAETISNLHLAPSDYSIDSVLTAYDARIIDKYAPEIVISIGGALVSRKLKEYLRRNSHKFRHWTIGHSHTLTDPFQGLSEKFEISPVMFFKAINSCMRKFSKAEPHITPETSLEYPESDSMCYKERWTVLRDDALKIKNEFVAKVPWSELKAFDILLKRLPSDYNLFLSNGTPVRYAQIISYPLPHASYCNRGVSGIDGSVSTAIGGAKNYKGKTVIITGDLSMAYDIGSLSLQNVPESFKIIVIDNGGGGIFRFIPSTSELSIREEYLCQPPKLPLADLSKGYGWEYFEIFNEEELLKSFPKFLTSSGKGIMRVVCDGALSANLLQSYMLIHK